MEVDANGIVARGRPVGGLVDLDGRGVELGAWRFWLSKRCSREGEREGERERADRVDGD